MPVDSLVMVTRAVPLDGGCTTVNRLLGPIPSSVFPLIVRTTVSTPGDTTMGRAIVNVGPAKVKVPKMAIENAVRPRILMRFSPNSAQKTNLRARSSSAE